MSYREIPVAELFFNAISIAERNGSGLGPACDISGIVWLIRNPVRARKKIKQGRKKKPVVNTPR
jgi:hypothetical protein